MREASQVGDELTLIEAETAAAVCRGIDLDEEPAALLDDEQTPREFLDALVEAGLLDDAIAFLAHGLPKREAVWWACLCARRSSGDALADPHKECLELAEAWVTRPNEDRRRAALDAAEAGEYETPAEWAAAAAAWTGGSLAPAEFDEVPPAETLAAKAVVAAVTLAAAAGEPQRLEKRQRKYLAWARDIAAGKRRWKRPRKKKRGDARQGRKGPA